MIGSAPEDELFDLPRGRQPGRRAPGLPREIIILIKMMMLLKMILMRVMMMIVMLIMKSVQKLTVKFVCFNPSSRQCHMDVSTTSPSVSWTMTKDSRRFRMADTKDKAK